MNWKLQSSFSNEDKERLKEEFRKASYQFIASVENGRALALWDHGFYTDVTKAIGYLEGAIRVDPDYGPAYNNIGFAYQQKGDYDRALEYYQKALEIGIMRFGKNHPYTKKLQRNLNSVKQKGRN